nr:hypothetical protein [Tanacetum cinerariifolium]
MEDVWEMQPFIQLLAILWMTVDIVRTKSIDAILLEKVVTPLIVPAIKGVKNLVEQPAERGNRSIESLQNFRVIHKSSISLKDTSRISLVHAIAPILSTKVPEYSLSMGYEHPNTTSETESDEIIKSGVEELVPIPSECEVTSEDETNEFQSLVKVLPSLGRNSKSKVLSDSEASSSSADEKISEVSYYLSESESESEFETSEYYDKSTNYGLFMKTDDDQEIFHDAIESASKNFIENHIDSQKDYDKSDVDHNDSEEKDQLVDKLIRKFNKKIVKCQNRVKKANQQSKDFENQNKDLQDKYDVLKSQTTTFEINNNELNEQMKELIEKNNVLLAQTKVLKDQIQIKHVVIDTHVECQEKYANLRLKDMSI